MAPRMSHTSVNASTIGVMMIPNNTCTQRCAAAISSQERGCSARGASVDGLSSSGSRLGSARPSSSDSEGGSLDRSSGILDR